MNEIELNDFSGFDRILFGDNEPDWNKFYNETTEVFTPPIFDPKSLAEYQLDHYALWLVIFAFELKKKPEFCHNCVRPQLGCYACTACPGGIYDECENVCPLDLKSYNTCGDDFVEWNDTKHPAYAYNVAHLRWKERSILDAFKPCC